jgi:hypothetical protein
MVAGGYGDGAWLRSVEFFDFKKGSISWQILILSKQWNNFHKIYVEI